MANYLLLFYLSDVLPKAKENILTLVHFFHI